MPDEWNLRAEILAATHRWHLILLVMLAGSLIGFAFALILPGPYRAEAGLHVSYNGDLILRNPDDYKNWQLNELDVLATSPDVLESTLALLQQQDSAWETVEASYLEGRLRMYWRNAGLWRMVAEHPQAEHSEQLVQAWRQAVVQTAADANQHALELPELAAQIQTVANQRAELSLRTLELHSVQQGLQSWLAQTASIDQDAPPELLLRWRALDLAARTAGSDTAGEHILAATPPEDAPLSAYPDWLQAADALAAAQLQAIEQQDAALEPEGARLDAIWEETIDGTRGLSVYVQVEPLDTIAVAAPLKERPFALMGAAGALLGLVVWLLVWMARPFRLGRA